MMMRWWWWMGDGGILRLGGCGSQARFAVLEGLLGRISSLFSMHALRCLGLLRGGIPWIPGRLRSSPVAMAPW